MKMNKVLKMTMTMAVALLMVASTMRAAELEPAVEPVPNRTQFNLSFRGGKPLQLVEAIAAASGTRPNVLIPPELADIEIQPMELRSVDVRGVFDSLSMLWRGSTTWVRSGSGSGSQMVYVLSRGTEMRQSRVFYVGHLLKKFKVDDITTAIRSTWELGGREAKAELKYHQDTQLLLAFGTSDQLNSMGEVLAQLRLALTPEGGDIKPAQTESKPAAVKEKL
jgi:hypothetical protein